MRLMNSTIDHYESRSLSEELTGKNMRGIRTMCRRALYSGVMR